MNGIRKVRLMNRIEFKVPGNPQALKRHRAVKRGRFIATYDPSAGDKQDFLAKAMEHRPEQPLNEPLKVSLIFSFARPKSHYGTGRNADTLKDSAPVHHASKPDCDNLAKFVLDALNGVYWQDDSIIAMMTVAKLYGTNPSVSVVIDDIR